MRLSILILSAATLAVACSGPPTAPTDHDVQGDWEEDYGTPVHPGSSFSLRLNEAGGRVDGTGAYTIEAGAPGTLAVSGTVAHDSLQLLIVIIPDPVLAPLARRDSAQFVGVLTSRDRIDGTLTGHNVGTPLALVRLAIRDPI